ncbi:type III secretion protein ATPase [Chlamydiifrater phoenicopteri]|uniref:type III secretion protein ATPase n=1 Tax=Chlamydiifrater phoenicopteri TaxID=2681469 RepID=UPI001BCC96EF|nr:type III secretion protein ATPase [Chlamydiifrater phoenicopteri]
MKALLQKELNLLNTWTPIRKCGRVSCVRGPIIHAVGLEGFTGEHCKIRNKFSQEIHAQIIGFRGTESLLMPFSETHYLHPGAEVIPSQTPIPKPNIDFLLGRTINAFGSPLDKGPTIPKYNSYQLKNSALTQNRAPVEKVFPTGIKLIDSFLTLGKGQRVAIFSEPGQGKTSLLSSIARHSEADVYVTALIGERNREVCEFLKRLSSSPKKSRTIAVIATSSEPATTKALAATTAIEVAEHFCQQGFNVLFTMDSLSRYGAALQEIGLALGEAPAQHHYPASVFHQTAKFIERAGNYSNGSITALYSVLCYQDIPDIFVDYAKSLLDGHITLSSQEQSLTSFPRIDLLKSLSRAFPQLTTPEHQAKVNIILSLLKVYKENLDIIQLGAYTQGTNPDLDQALQMLPALKQFATQTEEQESPYRVTVQRLTKLSW